jgi:hypothetical protein
LFSFLLHMDMNSCILHTEKHTLLHSWTLDVTDGSTTHQDAYAPLLYAPTVLYNILKIFNPPPPQWRNSPSWARAPSLPWLHSHTQMHHTVVGQLSTSDRPDAKTPMWQHTTITRDIHPCPRWDSDSQSQQANDSRPMPYTTRPLGLARIFKYCTYSRGAVGWGTALRTGRPRVRFLMVSLEFLIDIILPATLWSWGLLTL